MIIYINMNVLFELSINLQTKDLRLTALALL